MIVIDKVKEIKTQNRYKNNNNNYIRYKINKIY